ncbi:hypothetical protein HA399_17400 (plasmid) [Cobetia sp. UIB-001]|uniref:hypothetical protein n=1 Tax=unclassified Cobetia TaxID=2609414 RepID=UPI00384D26D8
MQELTNQVAYAIKHSSRDDCRKLLGDLFDAVATQREGFEEVNLLDTVELTGMSPQCPSGVIVSVFGLPPTCLDDRTVFVDFMDVLVDAHAFR